MTTNPSPPVGLPTEAPTLDEQIGYMRNHTTFPRSTAQIHRAILASLERLKQLERTPVAADAARYRHIQVHGFPVRNQTGDPDRRWVAFRDGKEFYGATPSFAIDAARSATHSEGKEGA